MKENSYIAEFMIASERVYVWSSGSLVDTEKYSVREILISMSVQIKFVLTGYIREGRYRSKVWHGYCKLLPSMAVCWQ